MYPGYFKNPVPPLCIVSPRIMYPRVQAKTPKICKIPGVLWPAIYGNFFTFQFFLINTVKPQYTELAVQEQKFGI